ncbi:MAG TPA: NAD(P)/FAD-dependent oxidoreductase [Archaeoglobus profundus]|nr:NAD(P)/FAD-dependent oxidoreductase [Archaeoglobus profundus]HIP58665.1 NAD(P)/FAD-dependent oxidoreductase [Archaeoglobus profundus]
MILVVGGGPAGSLCAIELGRKYDVLLIEEHQSAGYPVQCAGLVSKECYNFLKSFSKCKINDIRGAYFFSPNGEYVELEGKSRGVVIERKILDRDLIAKASEYGQISMKTKFIGISNSNAILLKDGEKIKVKFKYIIGADGPYSTVARCFEFERPQILSAIQIECKFKTFCEDMVELYFGNKYSKGFFAYAIPIDNSIARVGVISKENPLSYLKNLVNRHPSVSKRINLNKIIELNTGAIPIGLVNFVKDNVALIGDAAGMVKPYTGGGLYYLIKAVEALKKNFPDLKSYKKEYLKVMGKEYEIGMKIFKLYSILTDEDYNYLVKIAKDLKDYAKELHMDNPTTLFKVLPIVMKVVKRPRLIKKLLSAFAF